MGLLDIMISFVQVECCLCGVPFGLSAALHKQRREDHRTFCCPNGHSQCFTGKSEAEKLRDDLTRERARLDQEKSRVETLTRRVAERDRQVAARKAVATKLRKRIATGKCPCCHAQFKDLKHHMTTQHPHWNPEQAAEAIAARGATP